MTSLELMIKNFSSSLENFNWIFTQTDNALRNSYFTSIMTDSKLSKNKLLLFCGYVCAANMGCHQILASRSSPPLLAWPSTTPQPIILLTTTVTAPHADFDNHMTTTADGNHRLKDPSELMNQF